MVQMRIVLHTTACLLHFDLIPITIILLWSNLYWYMPAILILGDTFH